MRIFIADDHTLVCKGFEILINHQSDMEVIGIAHNGQDAYELVGKLRPDIALVDISMPPGESGTVTAGRICADFPDTKVIMLTMYDDREYLLYTVQNGVSGYLLKNASEKDLLEAIRTVYEGGIYICKEMVPYLVQGYVNRHKEDGDGLLQLAEREVEVLTLIAKGYGNKEIAEKLFLSVKTVESYKARIKTKLNLQTQPQLVEYAIKKKLLQL